MEPVLELAQLSQLRDLIGKSPTLSDEEKKGELDLIEYKIRRCMERVLATQV